MTQPPSENDELGADSEPVASSWAAYRGLLTVGGGQATRQALGFLRNIIIVRLISPVDYGVAATFAITITLLEMVSNLSTDILVVQSRRGNERRFQATVQLFMALRGLLNGVLMLLIAAPFAVLFDVPEAVWAFRVLAAVPLIRGFMHLDLTRMTRQMQFRRLVGVQVGAESLALACAWPLGVWLNDYSAVLWLLVGRQCLLTIGSHVFASRRYQWAVDTDVLRRVIGFGWPLMANGFLLFGIQQGDRVVIGSSDRLFANATFQVEDLGVYSVAVTLCMTLATVLAQSGGSVFLPVLSRCQKNTARFSARYSLGVSLYSVFGGFLGIGFVINGHWLVTFIYGDDYSRAGSLVGVLGAMYGLNLVRAAVNCATMARGDTRTNLVCSAVRALSVGGVLLVAWSGGGLVEIAFAGLGGEAIALIVAASRLSTLHNVAAMVTLRPTFVLVVSLAVAMLGRVYLPIHWSPAVAMGVTLLLFAILVGAMYLVCSDVRSKG